MSTESEKLYEEQTKTYHGFLQLAKWSAIIIAVVLIALYFWFVA